jgi:hypothetical protein
MGLWLHEAGAHGSDAWLIYALNQLSPVAFAAGDICEVYNGKLPDNPY